MSDIFNHEADAWECCFGDEDEDEEYSLPPFSKNRNYYHLPFQFDKLIRETEKAYLVSCSDIPVSIWLPKKCIREFDLKNRSMKIHGPTLKKILKDHVSNPA